MSAAPELIGRARVRRSLQRRRMLLGVLLVAAFVSLVLALVAPGGPVWGVHLAADALLVGYLAVLIHVRNTAADREMNRTGLGG